MCRLARCTTFLQTPNQLFSPHTRMSLQLENHWREDILGLSAADLDQLEGKNVIGTLPILPEKRKVKAQAR